MGTPPAPPYVNLFFAIKEQTLVPQFRQNLRFYRRYIDNIFGIWEYHLDPIEDESQWNAFKASLNDYHGLKWDTSPLVNFVN